MKFKRKRLFRNLWKVWLSSPNWKIERRKMWINLFIEMLAIICSIFNRQWGLMLVFLFVSLFIVYLNFFAYIKFLEQAFDDVLMNYKKYTDKKGEVEK